MARFNSGPRLRGGIRKLDLHGKRDSKVQIDMRTVAMTALMAKGRHRGRSIATAVAMITMSRPVPNTITAGMTTEPPTLGSIQPRQPRSIGTRAMAPIMNRRSARGMGVGDFSTG